MANERVCFGPRRHRRQPRQELQRLEHQLPRAVAPGCFQLERDAAVAPPPQALLREGRTQLRELKKLSVEVIREQSEKSPMAKKVNASFTRFQATVNLWDQVAEGAYRQLVAG